VDDDFCRKHGGNQERDLQSPLVLLAEQSVASIQRVSGQRPEGGDGGSDTFKVVRAKGRRRMYVPMYLLYTNISHICGSGKRSQVSCSAMESTNYEASCTAVDNEISDQAGADPEKEPVWNEPLQYMTAICPWQDTPALPL